MDLPYKIALINKDQLIVADQEDRTDEYLLQSIIASFNNDYNAAIFGNLKYDNMPDLERDGQALIMFKYENGERSHFCYIKPDREE